MIEIFEIYKKRFYRQLNKTLRSMELKDLIECSKIKSEISGIAAAAGAAGYREDLAIINQWLNSFYE